MNHTLPSARKTSRRIHRRLVVGLMAVIAAIAATLGCQSQNSSSSSSSSAAPPLTSPSAESPSKSSSTAAPHASRSEHRGALGEADGVVPDGVTVFDYEIPAVANLDPDLLKALRQAATAATDDGAEFYVNSGRRSPDYQNQLLREAVSTYGSGDEAARWVATAATSPLSH